MHAPDRTATSKTLETYLTRLDSALGDLSSEDRREILLETRSHVTERAQRDSSLTIEEILDDLGDLRLDVGVPADQALAVERLPIDHGHRSP